MIAQVNRFRNDARMVAPLTIVALLVVGYALKTLVPSGGPAAVRVKEVAVAKPDAAGATSVIASAGGIAATSNDPYFSPRLQGALDQAEAIKKQAADRQVWMQEMTRQEEGSQPVSPLPYVPTLRPLPQQTAQAVEGAPRREEPVQESAPPQKPQYRVSAILLGDRPLILLVSNDATLYLRPGERTPSGEQVVLISAEQVGLVGPTVGWLLDLHPEGK